MTDDLKSRFIAAIERTGDPLAPLKLQEAYGAAERFGKMMATIADKQMVPALAKTILDALPDDEIDTLAATPEFIMVLCSMLTNSLISYGANLGDRHDRHEH